MLFAALFLAVVLSIGPASARSGSCPAFTTGAHPLLDIEAAYDYACEFQDSNNPSFYAYQHDSANFVSQLLLAAGEEMSTGFYWNELKAWGTSPAAGSVPPLHTTSWASVPDLHARIIASGVGAELPAGQDSLVDTRAGDLIFWDWNPVGGTYDDVSMIVDGDGTDPAHELVASHIPDFGGGPVDSTVPALPGLQNMSDLLASDVGGYLHGLAGAAAGKYATSASCPSSDSGSGGRSGSCWSWRIVRITATVAPPGPRHPGETHGGWNPSEADCQACEGDPVNSVTGEFSEQFTDIAIPGRGPALALDRSYSSKMTSIVGRFGYGWTDSYAMRVEVDPVLPDTMAVHQENGSITRFEHQPDGSWEAPPRVFASLVHNGSGTWTFTRGKTNHYTFNSAGELTKQTDLNGETTSLTYSSGKLATVTDPGGRTLTFSYSGSHVSEVEDSAGRTVGYSYDGSGNLTSVTDLAGHATTFAYDGAHQMTAMTKPRGGTTTNVYDDEGRVISQSDPLGGVTSWTYAIDETLSGMTRVRDPRGTIIEDTYSNADLTSQTVGAGTSSAATTTYEYDPETNNTTKITDPNGHSTTSVFDADGNMVSQTDPLGRTTTWTYNAYGKVTTTTPPKTYGGNRVTTTYTYDEGAYSSGGHGNLTTTSTPIVTSAGTSVGTQVTRTIHGSSAHPADVTSIVDPRGNTWQYTYDAAGNKTRETQPATSDSSDVSGSHARVTRWAYDTDTGWVNATLNGRYMLAHPTATTCTPPAAGCTAYTHDDAGHVLVTSDGEGHSSTQRYDADGNVAAVTDADGNETAYTYDLADQLTVTVRADDSEEKTSYWPGGLVKEQIDPADGATSYTYDPLGNNTTTTDPNGKTTTYRYDVAGNVVAKADPGIAGCTPTANISGCTTYTYDAANRQTAIRFHDGGTPDVITTYDANGQRSAMTEGTGNSSWTRDSLGRVTSTTNGAGKAIGYAYDHAFNATAIDYPGTADTVERSFDPAGQMDQITDWHGKTSSFEYNSDGALTTTIGPPTTGLTDAGTPFGTAGSGNGQLNGANGAAVDGDGNVWIADSYNNRLEQFSAAGAFIKTVGSYGSGSGDLDYPLGMDVNASTGHVYVADYDNNRIEEFTTAGTFVRAFGSVGTGNGEFVGPSGVAVGDDGHLWVADTWNNRIQEFTGSGTFIRAIGTWGSADREFKGPRAITVADDTVYVADTGNNRVQAIAAVGASTVVFGTAGDGDGEFDAPTGIAVDPHDDNVYVTDTGNDRIEAFTPAGSFVAAYGGAGSGTGQLASPSGIAFTDTGDAYVNDQGNSRITAWETGAPVVDTTAYDKAGARETITIERGTADLGSFDYDRSPSGRITATAAVPADDHAYGYTALQQLDEIDADAYAYDDAGRPTQLPGGTTQAFDPAGQLTSVTETGGTTSFTYNDRGQRTDGAPGHSGYSYSYDRAGYLVGANTSVSSSYTYDGDGLRASKTVGATTTAFVWDQVTSDVPLLLVDGDVSYLYGPDGDALAELRDDGTVLEHHHDQQGSTRLLTDELGRVRGRTNYDPYGVVTASSGLTSHLGYNGQYTDAETGFVYLRARYYDPATAQFLTVDPLVGSTRSAYGYAEDDPLNAGDPSGLCVGRRATTRSFCVLIICADGSSFTMEGDKVHISKTGTEVSGHGWWTRKGINPVPESTRAIVTIYLEQQIDGEWQRVGRVVERTLKSGNYKRATARADCSSYSQLFKFRSVVDVDLIGRPDTSNKEITKTQSLFCDARPAVGT